MSDEEVRSCEVCGSYYEPRHINEFGICIDCQEQCCGTSKAPPGWYCTRPLHDHGPCAAHPICGHDRWTFSPPLAVRCPCWHVIPAGQATCLGTLRSDGRNKMDTMTFLICDVCGCCFEAEDAKRKEGA